MPPHSLTNSEIQKYGRKKLNLIVLLKEMVYLKKGQGRFNTFSWV